MDKLDVDEKLKISTLQKEKRDATSGISWMYTGNKPDSEDYLLGKRIDKHVEGEQDKPADDASAIFGERIKANIALDVAAKMREDPLFAIRRKEEESRKKLLENPIKMKELQKLIEQQEKLKKEKEKKKKRKHKKHKKSSDAGDSSDDELIKKYLAIFTSKHSSGEKTKSEKKLKRKKDEDMDKISDAEDKNQNYNTKRSKFLGGKGERNRYDSYQPHSGNKSKDDNKCDIDNFGNRYDDYGKYGDDKSESRNKYGKYDDDKSGNRNKDYGRYDDNSRNRNKDYGRYNNEKKHEKKTAVSRNDVKEENNIKKYRHDVKENSESHYRVQNHDRSKESFDRGGRVRTNSLDKHSEHRDYRGSESPEMTARGRLSHSDGGKSQNRNEENPNRRNQSRSKSKERKFKESQGQNQKKKRKVRSSSSSSSSHNDKSSHKTLKGQKYGLILSESHQSVQSRQHSSSSSSSSSSECESKIVTRPSKAKIVTRPSQAKRPQSTPQRKLTQQEKMKKLEEMMQNAEWREEQRLSNVKRYKEEEMEKEKKDKEGSGGFLSSMLVNHASTSSVEDRIKRNKYNIQRTRVELDKNFAKK